jgi:uncharacterized membrane protein YphA (DoxX/SURF4 family)
MPRYALLTIVFLVLLRLAIGWHFLFEGLHKYHTWQVGKTETNRPFTSEMYFRESTGPVAPLVRSDWFLGDSDEQALALLTPPANTEERTSPTDAVPPALAKEWDAYEQRFVSHFKLDDKQRELAEKKLAQARAQVGLWLTLNTSILPEPFEEAMFPAPPVKEVKKVYSSGVVDEKQSTPQRIADYRAKVAEMRLVRDTKPATMGKPVERAALAAAKADAASMRKELLDDLDKYTTALKDSLGEILSARVGGFSFRDNGDPDQALLASLEVKPPRANTSVRRPALSERMPTVLNKKWDDYADLVSTTYQVSFHRADASGAALEDAKNDMVAWLTSIDAAERIDRYKKELAALKSGKYVVDASKGGAKVEPGMAELSWALASANPILPLPQHALLQALARDPAVHAMHAKAPAPPGTKELSLALAAANPLFPTPSALSLQALAQQPLDRMLAEHAVLRSRQSLQADLDARTTKMTKSVAREALAGDVAKGYAPQDDTHWPLITWVDLLTILLLCVTGGCLLLGLFTRTNCLLAASFLVLTYLLMPPFPWIAAPPQNEGNYYYVNKNLIELLALLALATTRSGRWFGVDALLHCLSRAPEVKESPKKTDRGDDGPNGAASPRSPQPAAKRAPDRLQTAGK